MCEMGPTRPSPERPADDRRRATRATPSACTTGCSKRPTAAWSASAWARRRSTTSSRSRASPGPRSTASSPGGRDELLLETVGWELANYFNRLADHVRDAPNLAELLRRGLAFAHRSIAEHAVLRKILDTEPERLLPLLTTESAKIAAVHRRFLAAVPAPGGRGGPAAAGSRHRPGRRVPRPLDPLADRRPRPLGPRRPRPGRATWSTSSSSAASPPPLTRAWRATAPGTTFRVRGFGRYWSRGAPRTPRTGDADRFRGRGLRGHGTDALGRAARVPSLRVGAAALLLDPPRHRKAARPGTGKVTERRVWNRAPIARRQFSVLTGTVMHGSKISVRTWLSVIVEICSSETGVSAREIVREPRTRRPKTAWRMLQLAARRCTARRWTFGDARGGCGPLSRREPTPLRAGPQAGKRQVSSHHAPPMLTRPRRPTERIVAPAAEIVKHGRNQRVARGRRAGDQRRRTGDGPQGAGPRPSSPSGASRRGSADLLGAVPSCRDRSGP